MTYKNNLLASIVINNYNSYSFIKEAIDSALNQTYPNLEIIVVDDASTDGSQKIIASYSDRVIPIIKSRNEGQLAAYNTGFCKAKGDIIFILDGDDIFYPDKVEKIVNLFKNSQEYSNLLIYHQLNCIDRDGRFLGSKVPDPILHQCPANIYQKACDRKVRFPDFSFAASSGMAISRQLVQSIFPLPELENVKARADSFVYTLAALLGKVYGINQTLGEFRIHGDNYHQKHQKPSIELLNFLISLEDFLNKRLKENNKKTVVDLFNTIYSLYDYYYVNRSVSQLMELSLKALKWHLGFQSIKLLIKTIFIYLLFLTNGLLRFTKIFPISNNSSIENPTKHE